MNAEQQSQLKLLIAKGKEQGYLTYREVNDHLPNDIVDPEQIDGKAKTFTEWEDRLTIFDTLILCRFYRDLYQWKELSTILKATTGMELNSEKMRSIAGAITDNTRRFNLREGLTLKEDRIPRRFFREVLPETQKVITENQMEQLITDYYKERGWNEKGEPPKVES